MIHGYPFKAIRPKREYAGQVAALPYDVYTMEEAKQEIQQEPLSFLAIDRPDAFFQGKTKDDCFQMAKERLEEQRNQGIYQKEEENSYYIYELECEFGKQRGIVACISVEDYKTQLVKRHEATRKEKEEERIQHILKMKAQTGPAFLVYDGDGSFEEKIIEGESLLYEFQARDGVWHRVWKISDKEKLQQIQKHFEGIDALYIADGHHRTNGAIKVSEMFPEYSEAQHFLGVTFPKNQVHIFEYDRYVEDLAGNTKEEFIKKLQEEIQITKTAPFFEGQVQQGNLVVYMEGTYYFGTFRGQEQGFVENLEVSLLQTRVLEKILGITDPRTDPRISFAGGKTARDVLKNKVDTQGGVAFFLPEVTIETIMKAADKGQLMPPKSTWFEPKLRSGLFLHELS